MQLVKKGIVSTTLRSNVKYFTAESPERILSFLERKKQQVEDHIGVVSEQLPLFQQIVNPSISVPVVRSFTGVDGVISVYEDMLKSADHVSAVHDFADVDGELKKYILESYIPRRVKKRITCDIILPKNKQNKFFSNMDKKDLRNIRYLSPKEVPFDTAIFCYSGKTAIISYKKDGQFGTIVDSPAFYSTMRGIFQVLWNKSEMCEKK
jgi:sugar-specific transcriptional regulator TrmB